MARLVMDVYLRTVAFHVVRQPNHWFAYRDLVMVSRTSPAWMQGG